LASVDDVRALLVFLLLVALLLLLFDLENEVAETLLVLVEIQQVFLLFKRKHCLSMGYRIFIIVNFFESILYVQSQSKK